MAYTSDPNEGKRARYYFDPTPDGIDAVISLEVERRPVLTLEHTLSQILQLGDRQKLMGNDYTIEWRKTTSSVYGSFRAHGKGDLLIKFEGKLIETVGHHWVMAWRQYLKIAAQRSGVTLIL